VLAVRLPSVLACALPVGAILALVLSGPVARAVTESQRIIASDAAVNDNFGFAVSISGGAAILGAAGDDDKANNAGAAYIFRNLGNGTFTQQDKLRASDGALGDKFGSVVAIDGSTAVIGALRDTGLGFAYIFQGPLIGPWSQIDKLTGTDTAATDQFGVSVAVSGNMAVVGARKHNGSVGAAYIFRDNGASDWQQVGKLTPNDVATSSEFGTSVAISGNTVLVGAPFNTNQAGIVNGAVYVFQDNGSGVWNFVDKLLPGDGSLSKQFGTSVAFSANTAVIGAIGDNTGGGQAGAAYVFQRDGLLAWHQTDKLTGSDGLAGDRLGTAVALSGNMAVVGTNPTGGATGTAYAFRDNGTGNWQQIAKLMPSNAQADSSFGETVGISGSMALVGAALDNNNPNITDSGAGYSYALTNSLAGDYNKNVLIDSADYIVWKKQQNQSGTSLAADGNGDGIVNQADYQLWRENFGLPAGVVGGDYDDSHAVGAGDVNLVLNNWNASVPPVPAGWIGDQPDNPSVIGAQALNKVLNNWGATGGSGASFGAVPEPGAVLLALLAMVGVVFLRSRGAQGKFVG
jgi:FG-GAP repeat